MVYIYGDFVIAKDDPKVTMGDNGRSRCHLTLCSSRPFKNKDGEWDRKYTFYNAFAYGRIADKIGKMKKGAVLSVMGEPFMGDKWTDSEGKERYGSMSIAIVNITARKVSNSTSEEDDVADVPVDDIDIKDDLPF